MKGKLLEWYQDEYVGGYFDKDGRLVVCEEYGLKDEDKYGQHRMPSLSAGRNT